MHRKDMAVMMKKKKKMADRWHVINFSELNVTVIDWAWFRVSLLKLK